MFDKEPTTKFHKERYLVRSEVGKILVTDLIPNELETLTPTIIVPGLSEGSNLFKDLHIFPEKYVMLAEKN
jgi:hypothetical protein